MSDYNVGDMAGTKPLIIVEETEIKKSKREKHKNMSITQELSGTEESLVHICDENNIGIGTKLSDVGSSSDMVGYHDCQPGQVLKSNEKAEYDEDSHTASRLENEIIGNKTSDIVESGSSVWMIQQANNDKCFTKLSTNDQESDSDETLLKTATRSNTCENCGQEISAADNNRDVTASRSDDSICSMQSSNAELCRICHCESDAVMGPLIAPCNCKGTLAYVHHSCLQQWIKSSDLKHCELCGFHFSMDSKLKPFTKWEKLSMSTSERRKLIFSAIFHIIAITCVVWSMYVLIDRTAQELRTGSLQWPFWTKLVVVAIGFIGGLAFMYVQCKVYMRLWKRLKAFNRIIYVQSQPKNQDLEAGCSTLLSSSLEGAQTSPSRPLCNRDDAEDILKENQQGSLV